MIDSAPRSAAVDGSHFHGFHNCTIFGSMGKHVNEPTWPTLFHGRKSWLVLRTLTINGKNYPALRKGHCEEPAFGLFPTKLVSHAIPVMQYLRKPVAARITSASPIYRHLQMGTLLEITKKNQQKSHFQTTIVKLLLIAP